jgi:hypothetical protein
MDKTSFIKIYWPLIILFSVYIIFLFLNNFTLHMDNEIYISILGIFIASVFSLNTYITTKRKIFFETFMKFNERYDHLNENLNRLKNNMKIVIPNGQIGDDEYKFYVKNFIFDYLNLCCEEYYWRKQGIINKDVWNNWSLGIRYFLIVRPIFCVLMEEIKDSDIKNSYYGFLDSKFIKEIIQIGIALNLCNDKKRNNK